MDVVVAQGSLLFTTLRDMNSVNGEMMYIIEGLKGGVRIMLEFVQNRVRQDVPIDDVMLSQLSGTLTAIRSKIDELHALFDKRFAGIPYGRLWVSGGILFGLGAQRILTQLKRLRDDLVGDIQFLDLSMQSSQTQALYAISGGNLMRKFTSAEARGFWQAAFKSDASVDALALAEALSAHLATSGARDRQVRDRACAFATSTLATGKTGARVSCASFAEAVGSRALLEWVGSVPGAATTLCSGHSGRVTAAMAHRDCLVTASTDRTAKIFHLHRDGTPTLNAVLIGHSAPVRDVACADNLVATASDDCTARVWSATDGRQVAALRHDAPVAAVFFSGRDHLVTATTDDTQNISVFRLDGHTEVARMYGHVGGTTAVATVGETLFTVGNDRAIRSWRLPGGDVLSATEQAHDKPIDSICCDGRWRVATRAGGEVKVWRVLRAGGLRLEAHFDVGDSDVAATRDTVLHGRAAFIATSDPETGAHLVEIDARSWQVVASTPLEEHRHGRVAPSALCAHRGHVYVGMDDGGLRWGASGDVRGTVAASAERGSAFALFGPSAGRRPLASGPRDGFAVAAAGHDEVALLPSGAVTKLVAAVHTVHHQGALFYIGSDDGLVVLDGEGEVLKETPVPGTVVAIAVAPSTVFVATQATADRPARVLAVSDAGTEVIADRVHGTRPPVAVFGDLLVYPGARPGEMAMYDLQDEEPLPAAQYPEGARGDMTLAAARHGELWTVHGDMDVVAWNFDDAGRLVPKKAFATGCAITDIEVRDRVLRVALANGTVATYRKPRGGTPALLGHTAAHHRPGPVSLCGTNQSVGSEFRIF